MERVEHLHRIGQAVAQERCRLRGHVEAPTLVPGLGLASNITASDSRRSRTIAVTPALFVYGTLAPGRRNEHVMADVQGHWEPAHVRGMLVEHGWGAALGFRAVELDVRGDVVDGLLFTSEVLDEH